MIKVSIIGATGYTASELLRYLVPHPQVEIRHLTSRSKVEMSLASYYPHLPELSALAFEPLIPEKIFPDSDLVFICLPHGHSMEISTQLSQYDTKVIDLGADFRLKNIKTYETTYGVKQSAPDLVDKFTYGLAEFYRDEIQKSSYIANPGCFVTSALLGLIPGIKTGGIISDSIIIDSKTGVSGAGKSATEDKLLTELLGNFKAYNPLSHRHIPEIEQELNAVSENEVTLQFTPHLLPTERGIFSTIYASVKDDFDFEAFYESYVNIYKDEPFVHVLPDGVLPQMKHVQGTNHCHLSLQYDARTNRILILSIIDNLGKGAAGQAVQNMNIMFGFPEQTGFTNIALMP